MIQPPFPSPSFTSLMATLLLLVFTLAMVGVSDGAWCVCRPDQSSPALQKTLDYACGAGADCNPIHQNGVCYNPDTVVAHCSYAANSYYQRNGQNQQACDFSGTAQLVSTDPSQSGCTYPATPSAAGTSTGTSTPGASTPGTSLTPGSSSSTTTPGSSSSTTTPGTFNPNSPTTGTGTTFGSLGPSGTGFDGSDAGLLPNAKMGTVFLTMLVSTLALVV